MSQVPTLEARIFLAEQRGRTGSDTQRSFHTFEDGDYRNEHKQPFSRLITLNDDTLAPGSLRTYPLEPGHLHWWIPVVGNLHHTTGAMPAMPAEPGQLVYYRDPKPGKLHIRNDYDNELINYLYLRLRTDTASALYGILQCDIASTDNQLLSLAPPRDSGDPRAYLGRYQGRQETVMPIPPGTDVFIYVIEGAFEVQNRLLHARDGLALRHVHELEFEALSNEAVILAVLMPH